jgi:hypothetical protein
LPRFSFAVLLLTAVLPLSAHKLVIIDIDGLDARFFTDPSLHVKIPVLRKLARDGVVMTVRGVAPSDSWSAAASLVTGVVPSSKSQTLWQAAEEAGLKTALVAWPATGPSDAPFVFPGHPEARTARATVFDDVVSRSSPKDLAERIDRDSAGFVRSVWDDESAAHAALYLLNTEKPDLLLTFLSDANSEQHQTLALSIYARDVLENDDDLIGQIIARLPADTVVAIVSGHGFETENFVVRPKVLLKQSGIEGPVEVADGLIGTANPRVADRLRKLGAEGRKYGLGREVPLVEVRAADPRLAAWVVAFDTAPNTVASDEDHGPALGPGSHLGVNGLWPDRAGYRALLILSGPGIRPAKQKGETDMLRLAPTFADILGVKLPHASRPSLWPDLAR